MRKRATRTYQWMQIVSGDAKMNQILVSEWLHHLKRDGYQSELISILDTLQPIGMVDK
jgi:hypothetical protein